MAAMVQPPGSPSTPRAARRRRNLLVAAGIALWLAAGGWLAWSVYEGVRAGTAGQMAELEATLASQAARGISDHLAHLQTDLLRLSQEDGVVAVSAAGVRSLQRFYDGGSGEYQSVTRMGTDGTILYTWPNTSSIGSSIRGQAHVQRLLATHRPVLSDTFTSVQGYRSIALHVPVLRGGAFDGSIAVLIPVDWIAEHFVSGIRVGGGGYAWVIARDGVEIFCPNPVHVGTNAIDRPGEDPESRALAEAMSKGASGTVVLPRDHATGARSALQVSYRRIGLADSWWSVAVAAPENETLTRMSGFLRPWVFAIILLVAGIAAILLLAFRLAVGAERRTAREEAEQNYRSLVEKLPVINYVVELGAPNRTVYISPQVQNILGFTPEQWTADPGLWLRQVHPDDRARVEEMLRRNDARGEPTDAEYRVLTADGRVRWVHNRSLFAHYGGRVTINGLMLDITARREAEEALREREEQLQQARKLEAVGRLAGGVAHDFNNLLTVINGYADLLVSEQDLPPGAHEEINEILDASRRAKSLTDQLLTYSRKQVRISQILDLNAQVSQMQSMLRRLIGEHIALVTDLAPDLGPVRADPGQLQQVILNLAVNARDSMGDGGTLTIATSNLAVSAPVPGRPGLAAGEWVVLTVTDTGSGMNEEILSHVFEPFFTTKEKGKGTGLGLSTVYGIVTQGGGHVFVQSSPGRGASFEILLPRESGDPAPVAAPDPAAAPTPAQVPAPAAQPTQPLRVLLVEDEVLVRDLARSILTRAGYSVREAANGLEALSVFAASDRAVDLLLTDVIMPGMGGVELARRLTAQNPDLQVVFISGYAGEALGTQGELAAGIHLVRKPFSPAELLAMIERVRRTSG